ncbi:hypothetical protein DEO72_LG1g2365 [Vigna unguiculata]|uniref:Uncharacterized protein n=1 Tax=Vigna unguiculata TaxID=3917 RepID=A0A4D6KU32_VIGUN|nr:hypothetical protein DEO72_LG1g2365 [Vigna unguiculata]
MVVFVFAAAATATNYGSASPWSSDQVSLVHVGDAFAVEAFSSHAIVVVSGLAMVVLIHDHGGAIWWCVALTMELLLRWLRQSVYVRSGGGVP